MGSLGATVSAIFITCNMLLVLDTTNVEKWRTVLSTSFSHIMPAVPEAVLVQIFFFKESLCTRCICALLGFRGKHGVLAYHRFKVLISVIIGNGCLC